MRNDDVIQSIRYMLDLDDIEIAKILKLRGYKPERGEVEAIFANQDEPLDEKEEDCSDELMAHFLDGLIYYRRGKSEDHPMALQASAESQEYEIYFCSQHIRTINLNQNTN